MKTILWVSIIWWVTTAALLRLGLPILWTGLRTGRLPARGRIYDRDNDPALYWSGITFWIALFAFAAWFSLILLWGLTGALDPK